MGVSRADLEEMRALAMRHQAEPRYAIYGLCNEVEKLQETVRQLREDLKRRTYELHE